MHVFDVKPERIIFPKTCSSCKCLIPIKDKVFHGHSNYKSLVGDCSSYICEECVGERLGYIAECECGDYL